MAWRGCQLSRQASANPPGWRRLAPWIFLQCPGRAHFMQHGRAGSGIESLLPASDGSTTTWGPAPRTRRLALHLRLWWCPAPIFSKVTTVPVVPVACGARLNSGKSSTCSTNVESRIIRARPVAASRDVTEASKQTAGKNPADLPMAQVRHLIVDEAGAGQRLDNFLMRHLKAAPKTLVYRVIRSGEVRVNKGRASADTRVQMGDDVRVPPLRMADKQAAPPAPAREFPVLYEDDWLIAIDKPAGVAVHGGSGVSSGVIEQLRRARPQARFLELVHRLDRETSGVLLIAKKRSALTHLQEQFRARGADKTVGKTYGALVIGDWPERLKVIDVPLHKYLTAEGERRVRTTTAADEQAKRAITLVHVAARLPGFTLLDVTIKTGRTHQIRVHLASAGHPIAGDDKYGDFDTNRRLARGEGLPTRLARMFLHARRLRFLHPNDNQLVELEAPWPKECEDIATAPSR